MQQKQSPTKKNLLNNLKNSFKEELAKEGIGQKFQKLKKNAVVFITDLQKIRDITKNNYELGKKHYDLGNFDDAVFRFKFLTWMDPKNADSWYWLGASYIAVDKKPSAVVALKKALELKPDWQEAKDLLRAASGGK